MAQKNYDIKPQRRIFSWFAIVASLVLLLGIGAYIYISYSDFGQNSDLGTYDDPEIAFRETQKALSIFSTNLNIGIVSVQYIQEYDNSKNLIFKEQNKNEKNYTNSSYSICFQCIFCPIYF